MRGFCILLVAGWIVAVLTCSAFSVDYYVNCVDGSDENSGLSWHEAWATYGHACEMVSGWPHDPGIIHFAPGEYRDSYASWYLPMWVWLQGSGPGQTTLVEGQIIAITAKRPYGT